MLQSTGPVALGGGGTGAPDPLPFFEGICKEPWKLYELYFTAFLYTFENFGRFSTYFFTLLRATLSEAKRARSREPPSAITYGNSRQRISRLVLILVT